MNEIKALEVYISQLKKLRDAKSEEIAQLKAKGETITLATTVVEFGILSSQLKATEDRLETLVTEATRLFDAGWYACADLADRDDLPHDIGSPFYEKKLAAALGREGGGNG